MVNGARTSAAFAVLTALFMVAGFLIGGEDGALIALAVAMAAGMLAFCYADRLLLRAYGARAMARAEAPWLHDILAAPRGARTWRGCA